jgi:hypothetical protein
MATASLSRSKIRLEHVLIHILDLNLRYFKDREIGMELESIAPIIAEIKNLLVDSIRVNAEIDEAYDARDA